MNLKSIWEETNTQNNFAALNKDIRTNVLIIGGGICGILCAYMLGRAGVDYVLVEANTVCNGITKNTTAKITSQHGLIYHKLIEKFGQEKAKQYLQANQAAIEQYSLLCRNIDCDFEYKNSYVYSLNDRIKIDNEISALKKLGYHAELCTSLPLPFPISGAVMFAKQAQFNPLKFAAELSKGLNIYEHTRVNELIGTKAVTDCGIIQAESVIVATHFPFINKHGLYFLKLYQHRSYAIALNNAPQMDGMYSDEAKTGMSFRNYNGCLLVGGGSHRTGKKGGNWQELRDFAEYYYPSSAECYHWATQDCMSLDSIPYVGQYSANTKGLYTATGFNKWGMTSSMAAAMILTDSVQNKENPYAALFSPSRSILHPQLAVNTFETVGSLLTPTVKRCSHLGCALKWNPYEHTWDCSCHGSRFTKDGKLIDNPATGNLNANADS